MFSTRQSGNEKGTGFRASVFLPQVLTLLLCLTISPSTARTESSEADATLFALLPTFEIEQKILASSSQTKFNSEVWKKFVDQRLNMLLDLYRLTRYGDTPEKLHSLLGEPDSASKDCERYNLGEYEGRAFSYRCNTSRTNFAHLRSHNSFQKMHSVSLTTDGIGKTSNMRMLLSTQLRIIRRSEQIFIS